MLKKQIQKSIIYSVFLVALIAMQFGVLFLQAPSASAAGWNLNFLSGVLPEEVNGQVAEPNCTLDKMPMTGKIAYSHPSGPRGLSPVGLGDTIKVYVEIKPTVPNPPTGASTVAPLKKLQENCARQAKEGILNFRLKITNFTGINTEQNDSYVAKLKSEPDGQLALNFPNIVLKNLTKIKVVATDEIRFTIAADFRGTNYKDIATIDFLVQQAPVTNTDTVPTGFESVPSNTNPDNEVRKLEDIAFNTTILNKYRVLYDETAAFEQLKFGSNGLKAIKMDWRDPKSSLTRGNYVELPKEYDTSYWPDFTPLFNEFQTGFNYEELVPKEGAGCIWDKGWVYNTVNCDKGVFINKSIYGDISTVKAGSLPADVDPVIYEKAWQDKKPADVKADGTTDKGGKPLYSVKMAHVPIMYLDKSFATSRDWAVLMNKNPAKFEIEVFNTAADIKAACVADGLAQDICDDPLKMRYSIGKEVMTTSGTTAAPDTPAGQTLYAFITRVISDIIVWLQSVIYRIFAYIVAPILNALLRVRPYQDAFVNVIYPGWLILRNLANIFFIVSLLVVGLRILFQQSAATAARGFIMRLIIMALLVNFSLVIGQGIIGIADTVQSQFLPGETRIIEALGHKLMVEPLKNFRAEVTNSESGVFDSGTAEKGLSDTVKPIVLLILSIASFFAFIAIAAFLTVRLVALWVLYMLSPIAYVGFVMDETQQYARKWWDEFIKYAIMTPVLVFFLNIAALMAMSFSSGNTDGLFKFSDGSTAGDIVVGSLSVLTHFIVLFFIFAGMKFALSSGTAGSKSIVKYAKKGFDAVTTRPAKWAATKGLPGAKDFVGDQASTGMGKLFGKRAENITQALFKPLDAAKKLKQGAWDRPGEDRKKRGEKRLKTIDDQSYKIMNNKWKSAKYAASTLVGQGPKRKLRQGERKIDESQILTDDEKAELKKDLVNEEAKKKAHDERVRLLQEEGVIDADKVSDIEKGIDQSIIELDEEDAELEKKYDKYTKSGDTKRADAVAAQRKDIADRKGDLEAIQDAIFNAKSITLDGSVEIKEVKSDLVGKGVGGEDVKLSAVFDPDAYKAMLEKEGKDIEAEESRLNKRAEEDERRRKDYPNRVTMDLPTRAMLEKEGMEIQEAANKRFLPTSLAERASRVADEREESKKLEDVDDADELTEMFEEAMKKNNMALATAISKKLAKEGNFDKLLNANGYENNLKSFQAFMDKHFKNMAPQARYQIASEVGHLASQNGNTTFVKPTKVQGGVMRWSTPEEHAEVKSANIEKASSYDLAKKKKWELGYQRNGKSYLDKTTIDSLNNMPKEKLKKMTERTSAKFIKDLVKFANYHELAGHVQETLESKK